MAPVALRRGRLPHWLLLVCIFAAALPFQQPTLISASGRDAPSPRRTPPAMRVPRPSRGSLATPAAAVTAGPWGGLSTHIGGSPFYAFRIIAETGAGGPNTVTQPTLDHAPSLNNLGTIAFAGGSSNIFVGDGSAAPTNINPSYTRAFHGVQINDQQQVVAQDQGSGSTSFIRVWNASTPGSFTAVAQGGSMSPYSNVPAPPTINNKGQVAFLGQYLQPAQLVLATPKNPPTVPVSYNEHVLAAGTPYVGTLHPLIADNGTVLFTDSDNTYPVQIYTCPYTLTAGSCQTVAFVSPTTFSDLGTSPGISDDGTVIAFYGTLTATGATTLNRLQQETGLERLTPGPGIFAAVDEGTGGARRIVRLVGRQVEDNTKAGGNHDGICDPGETCKPLSELGYDDSGQPLTFASYDGASRLGVTHLPLGAAGIDDDSFVVSFIATPSAAARYIDVIDGTRLFNANKGLWTVRVDVDKQLQPPNARVYHPASPLRVAQVGDTIGGRTITDLTVGDPLANAPTDDGGTIRTQRRGDHRVVFWAATDQGDMIVRGTHLDSDQDGLLDHWETDGLDANGDGQIDLNMPGMGVSPSTRDLLLQADWGGTKLSPNNPSYTNAPAPGVFTQLAAMFSTAKALSGGLYGIKQDPTTGQTLAPDAIPAGITLRVDGGNGNSLNMGSEVLKGGQTIGPAGTHLDVVYLGRPGTVQVPPGVQAQAFDTIKQGYFDILENGARELAFREVIFADTIGFLPDNTVPFVGIATGASNSIITIGNQPGTLTMATAPLQAARLVPGLLPGNLIAITQPGSPEQGQVRRIITATSQNGTTTLTVDPAWTTVPAAKDTFTLLAGNSGIGEVAWYPNPDANPWPGNDALVTLRGWPINSTSAPTNWLGDPCTQWRTLAHELGHTLGLHHGGTTDQTYRDGGNNGVPRNSATPTYPSLMSYSWTLDCGASPAPLGGNPPSPVQSYGTLVGGNPATPVFDDWTHLRLDFQNSAPTLGNSFNLGLGGAPQDTDPEMTVADAHLPGTVFTAQASPDHGGYTAPITVAGTAYTAGETVTLYWDSVTAPPLVTTTASGALFTVQLHVPLATGGVHTLIAIGQSSGLSATVPYTVVPTTVLSPTTGHGGIPVQVWGWGFSAHEGVQIHWGGPNGPLLGSGTTDGSGSLSGAAHISATVPLSPSGVYPVVAVGLSSGLAVTSSFTLSGPPALTLNPNAATPFRPVTATVSGFSPSEPVALYWDSTHTTALTQTTAQASGAASVRFSVPQAISGTHTLIAVGLSSGRYATAPLRVTPLAVLADRNGPGGTTDMLLGFGFGPTETVTAAWTPGGIVLGHATTNALGSAAGPSGITFTVPLSPAGSYTVYALGATSKGVAAAPFTLLAPTPTATPSSTATASPTPMPTSTALPTGTVTPRSTATATGTPTTTPTTTPPLPSVTATASASSTGTATPTPTGTATPTTTATAVGTATATPSPYPTLRPTRTPTSTPAPPTATATPSHGTVSWIASGGGDWDTATNWSGGQVPGPTDSVVIDRPGSTVTHAQGALDAAYTLSSTATLAVSAGTLTLGGPANLTGGVALSGGTLGDTGTIAVTGPFTWTTGMLNGPGQTTLTGSALVAGNGYKSLSGLLDVQDTLIWSGAGTLTAYGGGALQIEPAATLVAQADTAQSSSVPITNAGTFTVAGPNTVQLNSSLTSNGQVQVQQGTLILNGGGSASGLVGGGAQGTLALQSSYTFATGSSLAIPNMLVAGGTVTISSSVASMSAVTLTAGTMEVETASPTQITDLSVSGGTLDGSGTVQVDDLLTWTGGTMSGSGTTIVAGGEMDVNGGSVTLARTLDNAGTMNWSGSSTIYCSTGATLINEPWALFFIAGDAGFTCNTGHLLNAGLLQKVSGSGTTTLSTVLTNTGTLDVQSGTLQLAPSGGSSSGTISGGAGTTIDFTPSSPTYLMNSGSHVTAAALELDQGTLSVDGTYSAGSTTVTGGTLQVASGATQVTAGAVSVTRGGTLDLSAARPLTLPSLAFSGAHLLGTSDVTVTGPLTWTAGTLGGSGRLVAAGGLAMTVNGSYPLYLGRALDNAGAATWNGTGSIICTAGGEFTNRPGATLLVQSDLTFTCPGGNTGSAGLLNAGVLRKTGGAGTLHLSGPLTNTGTLAVQSGTLQLAPNGGSSNGTIRGSSGTIIDFAGAGSAPPYTLSGPAALSATMVQVDQGSVTVRGTYTATTSTAISGTLRFAPGAAIGSLGAVTTGGQGILDLSAGPPLTVSTLNLGGQQLTGTSDMTVTGPLTWTSGTMDGSGHTVAAGGMLLGGTSLPLTLDRGLDNLRAATWNGTSALTCGADGRLTNHRGATILLQTDTQFDCRANGMPGQAGLVNAGLVQKVGGTGISALLGPITNTGILDVRSGTLRLYPTGGSSSGVISGARGTTVDLQPDNVDYVLSGPAAVSAAAVLVDAAPIGRVIVSGGYTATASTTVNGTLRFAPGATIGSLGAVTIGGGGGGILDLSAGSPLTVPALTIGGQQLTGTSDLTVTGPLTWTSGTMDGSGHTIAAGGLNLNVPGGTQVVLGRSLDNGGMATWSGDGNIVCVTDGRFTNRAGARVLMQGNGWFNCQGDTGNGPGQAGLVNAGLVQKVSGSGTTTLRGIITNTGTLDVQSGTLKLQPSAGVSSGTISGAPGTTLDLEAWTPTTPYVLTPGSTLRADALISNMIDWSTLEVEGSFAVTGTTTLNGGTLLLGNTAQVQTIGPVVINGGSIDIGTSRPVTLPSLDMVGIGPSMQGATLQGSATVTVSGPLTWTSGIMTGTGTTIAAGGLSIGGDPACVFCLQLNGRTLENRGAATWDGAELSMDWGAVFHNSATGSLTITGDGNLLWCDPALFAGGAAPRTHPYDGVGWSCLTSNPGWASQNNDAQPVLLNQGILTKVGGSGLTTFDGTGQVFGGGYAGGDMVAVLSSGTVDVRSGVLAFGPRPRVSSGSGYTQSSGVLRLDGGAVSTVSALAIDGGQLSGSGTITGSVLMGGQLDLGTTPAVLTISGAYTQAPTGTLSLKLGGSAPGASDQLTVAGAATLAGTLVLSRVSGYSPALGDSMPVLTCGSCSGHFGSVSGGGIDGTKHFAVEYGSSGVTVRVVTGAARRARGVGTPGQAVLQAEPLMLTSMESAHAGGAPRATAPARCRGTVRELSFAALHPTGRTGAWQQRAEHAARERLVFAPAGSARSRPARPSG